MKKQVQFGFLIMSFLLVILSPLSISAQVAAGCDGNRYVKDVFTDTAHTKGVLYGRNFVSGINVGLFMDVIEPKGDAITKRPLIIMAFGGGFVQGTRNEKYMLDLCQIFAKKGYVCATIDYRLYDLLKGFPDSTKISPTIVGAIHDMKAAIRYFRKDAKGTNTFKVDTNNIILGGLSAGAITAMHVAHLDSTDVIAPWLRTIVVNEGGFEGNSGNPGFSSSVKGVISLSGGLYQKEYIDAGDVPFIAYHGTADVVVPHGYGVNVYGFYTDGDSSCNARARSLGIRSSLITVKGGGHTDIYDASGRYAANFADFLIKSSTFTKQLVCGETLTLPTQDIESEAISVFPNPARDLITFRFDKQNLIDKIHTEGYRLTVMDALGRQVFDSGKQFGNVYEIPRSAVGRGFFIAHLTVGSSSVSKKIVFE